MSYEAWSRTIVVLITGYVDDIAAWKWYVCKMTNGKFSVWDEFNRLGVFKNKAAALEYAREHASNYETVETNYKAKRR